VKVIIDPFVERFIFTLEDLTIAKVLRTIDLLEKFGYRLGMPHSKKVANNLFELRVRGKQEVRIFYLFSGSKATLFHSFVKKAQKTPKKELAIALKKLSTVGKR